MNRASDSLTAPAAPAWFRFETDHGRRLGIAMPDGSLRDAGVVDPAAALAAGGLRAADLEALASDAAVLEAPPQFAVPLDRPSKILCLGKNFAAHAAEFGAEVPKEPIFFTKLVDSLLPHGGTILLPHWVETRIDHEVELAVVLGFAGGPQKYVERERALELVAGYSIFNDVTARTMQHDDRGAQKPWLRCKSFDTFGPFGPWVVPADATDMGDRAISLRIGNDEVRQQSRTSLMVVGIAAAIEYLSRHTSLRSGDLIAMGTPAGVGPLTPGDLVTCEIEGIGRLVNPVARE